jgi:predicted PurR-regulated permease PerM
MAREKAPTGTKQPRARERDQLSVLTVCVATCTVILAGFALWALRHILTPVALAVFLLLLIDGLARALSRRVRGLPRFVAMTIAVAFIVVVFGSAIWLAADNGAAFAAHTPEYEHRLNFLLNEGAAQLNISRSMTLEDLIHQANPARFVGAIAGRLSDFAEGAVFVLVYLGFLLASRRGFDAKWPELFGEIRRRHEARLVFERIRLGVESYVWVQTVVGVIIAGVSAILMAATGLPHVLFWAFIIFMANYIPAIGAAIGVLLPPLFGLLEFNDVVRPLILLIGMEAVHFSVSHVLQPRMQGKRLNLDPVVVLFALAFWSVIWGVTGALLSTPLTVIAMAILAEFKSTRPLAVLLSGDGKPYADLAIKSPTSPAAPPA